MTVHTPSSPAGVRPSDFTARMTRRSRARGVTSPSIKRHLGRRLAVLAAAIAVPAMAAPDEWSAGEPATANLAAPMAFETPGESFPGSAFYYLADQPYLPQTPAAGVRPAAEAGIALPRPVVDRIDPGPMARAMLAAGSLTDRARALQCLTMAIYYEAATEPDAGQRAVAQVVLNRVAHPSYPDTVCGVVFQGSERTTGCQFSFTCDGALARKPSRMWWDRAQSVARAALAGAVYGPVGLATHYHTVQIHPYWADSLDGVGTIGAHRFYRWRGAAGRPNAFIDRYLGGEPIAAPHPRLAVPAAAGAIDAAVDPLALARAYEAGLQGAASGPGASVGSGALSGPVTGATTRAPAPAPAARYAPEVEARGGDALFRLNTAPAAGAVREEYARSGQWLRQP